MGNVASTTAVVTSNTQLAAARALYQTARGSGIIFTAGSKSITSTTALATATASAATNPVLAEARRVFSTTYAEQVPFSLPHATLFGDVPPAAGGASSFHQHQNSFPFVAWQQEGSSVLSVDALHKLFASLLGAVSKLGAKLRMLVLFLVKNPKLLLAGGVGVTMVCGAAYLVVQKGIISQQQQQQQNANIAAVVTSNTTEDNSSPSAAAAAVSTMPSSNFQQQQQVPPPDHLCCSITGELFDDPVLVSSGHTYERVAIMEWLGRGNGTCPLTRQPIQKENVVPNYAVRSAVEAYLGLA